MSDKLNQIIGECLTAAASGPFFDEMEFHTLFGLERSEVAPLATNWPQVDQNSEAVELAINNAFVNLTGYPIDSPQQWPLYISVNREELGELYSQWLLAEPGRQGGLK